MFPHYSVLCCVLEVNQAEKCGNSPGGVIDGSHAYGGCCGNGWRLLASGACNPACFKTVLQHKKVIRYNTVWRPVCDLYQVETKQLIEHLNQFEQDTPGVK